MCGARWVGLARGSPSIVVLAKARTRYPRTRLGEESQLPARHNHKGLWQWVLAFARTTLNLRLPLRSQKTKSPVFRPGSGC